MQELIDSKRFQIQQLPSQDSLELLKSDVLEGLFHTPRSLPPKYFYDEEGSALFDEICRTEDYYPTRTEAALLEQYVDQINEIAKANTIIELGAGTSAKTELLLSNRCSRLSDSVLEYISIDVCYEILLESAARLLNSYENLTVNSIAGEYFPAIQSLTSHIGPALYLFIGSSIGNFTEHESINLLAEVAKKMKPEDSFLIGIDRIKDKNILERAYDDAGGVTAKFNLNVLNVMNYKLGANFNLEQFSHQALYNEHESQIEMYLVSLCDQEISFSILNKVMKLKKGEKILTEISRKYTKTSIRNLLDKSNLEIIEHYQPSNEYFSLVLAKRKTKS